MGEHSIAMKAKEKEVLDLQATLTDTKEWNLREEERNRRREQELIAENEELRNQHTTFKELADEFMLKWKIVNEQKEQLTDSITHCKKRASSRGKDYEPNGQRKWRKLHGSSPNTTSRPLRS